MRVARRIKEVRNLLEKSWSSFPDQRLGQFFSSNYVCECYANIFYLDEESVEMKLKHFLKKIKTK